MCILNSFDFIYKAPNFHLRRMTSVSCAGTHSQLSSHFKSFVHLHIKTKENIIGVLLLICLFFFWCVEKVVTTAPTHQHLTKSNKMCKQWAQNRLRKKKMTFKENLTSRFNPFSLEKTVKVEVMGLIHFWGVILLFLLVLTCCNQFLSTFILPEAWSWWFKPHRGPRCSQTGLKGTA